MKQEFVDAYRHMLVNLTTITSSGYHNANAANGAAAKDYCQGHAKALTNFANATTSDRATADGLVKANSSLITQLETVTEKLVDALCKITLICSKTPTLPNTQFKCHAPSSVCQFTNKNYCWTCG